MTIETPKRKRGRPKGSRTGTRKARANLALVTEGLPQTDAPAQAPRRRRQRATQDEPGGITALLRSRVQQDLAPCETCGEIPRKKMKLADEIGLTWVTLRKFATGGKLNSDSLDKVYRHYMK